jgi:hypothetical protein
MKTLLFTSITGRVCVISIAFLLTLATVRGGSATWSVNPTNSDWNNPANWTPPTVPNGPSDVATFSTLPRTSSQEISLSAPVIVAEIAFDTDVSSYKITCAAGTSLTAVRNLTPLAVPSSSSD